MEKTILDAIKSKLPEAEVGAIKSVIEDYNKCKSELDSLTSLVETKNSEIKTKNSEIEEYKKKETNYKDLATREIAIVTKEKELVQTEADLKSKVPMAESAVYKNVFETIFRPASTRTSYQEKLLCSYSNNGSGSNEHLEPAQKTVIEE